MDRHKSDEKPEEDAKEQKQDETDHDQALFRSVFISIMSSKWYTFYDNPFHFLRQSLHIPTYKTDLQF